MTIREAKQQTDVLRGKNLVESNYTPNGPSQQDREDIAAFREATGATSSNYFPGGADPGVQDLIESLRRPTTKPGGGG